MMRSGWLRSIAFPTPFPTRGRHGLFVVQHKRPLVSTLEQLRPVLGDIPRVHKYASRVSNPNQDEYEVGSDDFSLGQGSWFKVG